MTTASPKAHVEAERDLDETAFTPILRKVFETHPGTLAVALVDAQGECVDYCASIEAFETKVIAAHLWVLTSLVVRSSSAVGFGQPHEMHIEASEREFFVRRVGKDYAIVVVLEAGGVPGEVRQAVEGAVQAVRAEGHIEPPHWEPQVTPLDVEVRASVGWKYAPASFSHEGQTTAVSDVLGRWVDEEERGLVCFRVRTTEGHEVTLAHDAYADRWMLLS